MQRLVIGETEDVVESVTGNIVARVDILRRIPPELTTYLDRVIVVYPGKSVLVVDAVLPPRLRPTGVSEIGDRRYSQERNFRMRKLRWPGPFVAHRAELEFIDLVRGEDVRFVHTPEQRALISLTTEVRPGAPVQRVVVGAVDVSEDLVFARPQLMIEPHTELVAVTVRRRGERGGAIRQEACRRVDETRVVRQ